MSPESAGDLENPFSAIPFGPIFRPIPVSMPPLGRVLRQNVNSWLQSLTMVAKIHHLYSAERLRERQEAAGSELNN
jgi:hypothetical protein